MIKDIFLPEKIHSFYLFTRHIVAFEVSSRTIFATVIRAHRNKRVIQKFLEETYDPLDPDGLLNALKALIKRVGPYDDAYVALPSSLAVFKTIHLPFTAPEKIKLVLPFEVEPLLPFSLQDAALDAVINTIDTQKKSSEVFVAAIKRSTLDATLMPFITAGIRINKVTIGALELYGILRTTQFIQQNGVSFIIDLAQDHTTILLLVHGNLRSIRVLPEGFSGELARTELATEQHDFEAQRFFTHIQFTIQAMIKNERIQEPIAGVLLAGLGAQLSGISTFVGKLLECPCTAFHPNKILHNGDIVLEHEGSVPPEFTISLATALSSPFTEDFNIGRLYESGYELEQFKRQTITAMSLLALMFISFFTYSYFTARTLRLEARESKTQVINELKKAFELDIKTSNMDKISLESVMDDAQRALDREETIWFALSKARRFAFLNYLQEIFPRIDRDKAGLTMKRLSIKSGERSGEDTLILEGSVRDSDGLIMLEEGLHEAQTTFGTKLFTDLPPSLQNLKFNLSLKINKEHRGTP